MKFTIKQAREYRGLTQGQIAKKLGIARRTYQRYEWGEVDMRMGLAQEFSKTVDIPMDQLVFDSQTSRIV